MFLIVQYWVIGAVICESHTTYHMSGVRGYELPGASRRNIDGFWEVTMEDWLGGLILGLFTTCRGLSWCSNHWSNKTVHWLSADWLNTGVYWFLWVSLVNTWGTSCLNCWRCNGTVSGVKPVLAPRPPWLLRDLLRSQSDSPLNCLFCQFVSESTGTLYISLEGR